MSTLNMFFVEKYQHFLVEKRALSEAFATGRKIIKLFSCSTQLSMKISLLINMKMPTIVGIFIY